MNKNDFSKNLKEKIALYIDEKENMHNKIIFIDSIFDEIRKKKNLSFLNQKYKVNNEYMSLIGYIMHIPFLQEQLELQSKIIELIEYITTKNKEFNGLFKINVVIDNQGNTLLHLATKNYNTQLSTVLLTHGANKNLLNKENKMPIHYANNENIQRNIQGLSIKEKKKQYKIDVIKNAHMKIENPSNPVEFFMNEFYLENYSLWGILRDKFNQLYRLDFVKTIIDFVSLSIESNVSLSINNLFNLDKINELKNYLLNEKTTIDEREVLNEAMSSLQKKINKKFKIIAISQPLGDLDIRCENSNGVYTNKQTVYLSVHQKEIEEIISIVLHETMHYIINTVYGNKAKPYLNEHETHFKTIREEVTDFINKLEYSYYPFEMSSEKEKIAFKKIQLISRYDASKIDSEIFVRFIEILFYLGKEEGQFWLENHLPLAYTYFESKLLCDIKNHLYLVKEKISLLENIPRACHQLN